MNATLRQEALDRATAVPLEQIDPSDGDLYRT